MGKMKPKDRAEEEIEDDLPESEFEDKEKFEITEDPDVLAAAFKKQTFQYTLLRRSGKIGASGKELVARFTIEYQQLSWDEVNALRNGKKLPKNLKRLNSKFNRERSLEVLQAGIKYVVLKGSKIDATVIDGERFTTDLTKGVISFADLMPGEVRDLEALIAPGLNKSDDDLAQRAIPTNNATGKDLRVPSQPVSDSLRVAE